MNAILLNQLFEHCERTGASDIHLSAGLPPYFRIKGALQPAERFTVLEPDALLHVARALMTRMSGIPDYDMAALLGHRGAVDGACTSPGKGRYRFNIFRCQASAALMENGALSPSGISIALRRLEDRFRSLEELGISRQVADFCDIKNGLVIVSGPTGSGKSTTLATLLDMINRSRAGHVITIEDPVEYVHTPIQSLINQRQVGVDASSFHDALVDSLREDPDIILVGEIREMETIRTAITAAETGHLVFTTLHAGDCAGAIERLVSVFPAGEQESIRRQLALVLRGILVQHLIPSEKADEGGLRRIPACELMFNTPAVANLIATGKTAQLYTAIETGSSLGMQTLEQDLVRLYLAGEIRQNTALALAHHPDVLRNRLRSLNGNGKERG